MNTKLLIIILFFSLSNIKAQSHRFIYEYKFVPDSTKTDSILTENTRLEIFKDHSEFLSNLTAKRDSAIASTIEKNQSQTNVNLREGIFKNKIYKSKKLNYSLEFIGIQPFKVIQNEKLTWKLLNETKKIQGYTCQKAILNYGKRKWEAWFTQEIPIQDGPHIFENLPGLIIQINDTRKQHSFLLIANYKTLNMQTNMIEKRFFSAIKINRDQFNKKWNTFTKNPIGGTEQFMIMNPGLLSGESFDANGNKIDMTQTKRDEQNYAEKMLKQNNNYLDLELYK